VVFTLKALVVVIMGGVGNLLGALIAGLILGLVENYVAVFVDPGLTLAATYAIFLLVLLVRPQGILGRSSR
jgi:branched-chain amino acid transport system permease protein